MRHIERDLNALLILILCGVLISAFGVQFIYNEKPCPLCLLQRLGMIGAACGAVLNIRFGIRMSHYALIILSSIFGAFVAIRQISLHICPGFSTFGMPVLGLSLYTWSFVVFVCIISYTAFLLFLYDPKDDEIPLMNAWSKLACSVIFLVSAANIVTAYMQCGFCP